jgi:hypothetical protein
MDFRQLRTLSCVAELGSLSKASDTLRVAQPALSRQITISNPAPMRELTIASPIDHPGSTAITLVTGLLRKEVSACREEGLWDISLG